jgi:hypothetical protein
MLEAWVGRDNETKRKHRNDFDKNVTDRKQRGRGDGGPDSKLKGKRREQHTYTAKAENVQTGRKGRTMNINP